MIKMLCGMVRTGSLEDATLAAMALCFIVPFYVVTAPIWAPLWLCIWLGRR